MACRGVPTLHVYVHVKDHLATPYSLRDFGAPHRERRSLSWNSWWKRSVPSRVPAVRARTMTLVLPMEVMQQTATEQWKFVEFLRLQQFTTTTIRLDSVVWPPRLKHLVLDMPVGTGSSFKGNMGLGDDFNLVVWPSSLQELQFGSRFNQSIAGTVWPASLRKISFGDGFNKPIAEVAWPASLQELSFGNWFNQPIAGTVWPASLRK
ncbi:unnamed protein product, partial [Ectocarpus sp. 8 AP-2014]